MAPKKGAWTYLTRQDDVGNDQQDYVRDYTLDDRQEIPILNFAKLNKALACPRRSLNLKQVLHI